MDKRHFDVHHLISKLNITEGYNRNQKIFMKEAMLYNCTAVLTQGTFLTGYLVYLGLSNYIIGIVGNSAMWAQMVCIFASVINERAKNQKRQLLYFFTAGRLLVLLPILLPALFGLGSWQGMSVVVMVILSNFIISVYNTGFSMFFMDNIPEQNRTAYIYNRIFWIRIAFSTASVVMSFVLDYMDKSYLGYVLVFGTAAAFAAVDLIYLLKIRQEDIVPHTVSTKFSPKTLWAPMQNKPYREFLIYTFAFYFFITMASSYTAVYQLKYLDMSFAFLAIYSLVINFFNIISVRLWAPFERKRGTSAMLLMCCIFIALEFFVYFLLTKQTLYLIVLSPIFSGLGNGGYWACVLPYRYSLMPKEGKRIYEGWFSCVFGSAGFLGAVIGGKLQILMPTIETPWIDFSQFQFMYLLAGILAIGSAVVFGKRMGTFKLRSMIKIR